MGDRDPTGLFRVLHLYMGAFRGHCVPSILFQSLEDFPTVPSLLYTPIHTRGTAPSGAESTLTSRGAGYRSRFPRLSPDWEKPRVQIGSEGLSNIWIHDIERDTRAADHRRYCQVGGFKADSTPRFG